jgi:hypothetical protein
MKIEIGESLVYSWLRHVKQCQIVQTNWKVSPKWQSKNIDLDSMKTEIENEFKDKKLDIFHKNSSINQLLQQAEIDVVGISNGDDNNNRLYHFVDVAFHEGGLNYGTKEETISRVLKKFIRSYFIYLKYFDDHSQGIFYFITPKMSNNILTPLRDYILKVTKVLKDHQFEADFQLLVNQGFEKHVLMPTIDVCHEIADTNELFLRSVQLWKMFDKSVNLEVITPQPDQKEINISSDEQKSEQPLQNEIKTPSPNISKKPSDMIFLKLHRIKLWAKKSEQINHKIIKAYLDLEKPGPVFFQKLQDRCTQQPGSLMDVKSFNDNYSQMKTDAGNSHGKVFFDDGVIVSIHPPVREEIKKWFEE